jgi:hypothetical protein
VVAGEFFFGFALAPEGAFKGTPGTWVSPRGLRRTSVPTATREALAREDALNSRGDRYAATPGAQQFTATIELELCAETLTDLDPLLTSVIGTKQAGGSISLGVGSDHDTAVVSSGTPSAIVRAVGSDGKTYYPGVTVFGGGTATLSPSLPTGVSVADIDNPSALAGASYLYQLGDSQNTFALKLDWRSRPTGSTQRTIHAQGCAVTRLSLTFERGRRAYLAIEFTGAQYTVTNAADGDISDPGALSRPIVGFALDLLLARVSDAPELGEGYRHPKRIQIDLAPPLLVETGAQGLAGGSDASSRLAGSDTYGYTREPLDATLTVRAEYDPDLEPDWEQADAVGTPVPYLAHLVAYAGVPGLAPSLTRLVALFPRLVQDAAPTIVVDGGGRYQESTWRVERSLTATALERYALALLNS